MRNKKRRILVAAMAAVLVLTLSAGLMLPAAEGNRTGNAYAAANQWNPAVDDSDSGEPIPGQYIVKKKNGDIELVKTNKGIEELKKDGDIVSVEQNRVVTAFDVEADANDISTSGIIDGDVAQMQYGDEMVRAPEAWEMMPEDTATVRVAVIDTGIDATHPELADCAIEGTTIIDTNAAGDRYADDAKDDHGHGTHVAGIIAAAWNNGIGINGIAGKAKIEILPVKVLNDAGKGSTYDIIEGIRYAADHGASILNLSLGSGSSSKLEAEAVRYAQNKGCLVIAASGNDSIDVALNWPASYEDVISVGSVDAREERSYFSNYGETLDVAAPGSDIISSIPKSIAMQESAQGGTVYGNDQDGYYVSWSGTSMATPHVAGAAALYKAVNPGVTGADIGTLITETARDVGDIGKDIETGSGIVDAAAMLDGKVIKTPLKIKSPAEGSELYEEVTLSAQVNPTMDIKTLKFYLDEAKEENLIAQEACSENNTYYDIVWDTSKARDGEHTILAAVYDSKGQQVGETQNVKVTILNTITDGFTLQVTDPLGGKADRASCMIYGKEADGTCQMLKSISTSELGYARVKGLSRNYSEYMAVISGKCADSLKDAYYIYKHNFSADDLGTKILISETDAEKAELTTEDAKGNPFAKYYLRIGLKNGEGWLSNISPVTMNSDTELYLSAGDYRAEAYQSADADGRAYYITTSWSITSASKTAEITADGASKVTADYAMGVSGTLELQGNTVQDKIPFLTETIQGKEIYLTPGGEYIVSADMSAEQDGQEWGLTMEKKESVSVGEADVTVDFKPDIQIQSFTLGKMKEDETGRYMYTGESFSTVNEFGDVNGDVIRQATQTYPTFRIYKDEDGKRSLIYEKTDRGNADSSYWNSKTDYNGNIPPTAGSYIAQLSYDAGPFGGATSMEQEFQLKTKSGGEEMTSTILMDGQYKMTRATMELYTWNEKGGGMWQKANRTALAEAGSEDGVIRGINIDNIDLSSSGINAAVIRFNGRKSGYMMPEDYKGFAVVSFRTLDELQEIDLSSGDFCQTAVKITDRYGNDRRGNLYLPVKSDGGKLAEAETLTDLELAISEGTQEKIHIPKGKYAYVYSCFRDSTDNYFVTGKAFDTADTSQLTLDGKDTQVLSLDMDSDLTNVKLMPEIQDAQNQVKISASPDSALRMTPGSYNMGVEVCSRDGQFRYTIDRENTLEIEDSVQWKIGMGFVPEIKLKQQTVAQDQILLADLYFRDGNGNLLQSVEKMQEDGFFSETYPSVTVGAQGLESRTFSLGKDNGYRNFAIDPEYYYGEGPHEVSVSYDLGGGAQSSVPVPFVVGVNYEPSLTPVEQTGLKSEQSQKDKVKVTAKSGAEGYLPIAVQLNNSSRERTITFTQYRNNKELRKVRVSSIFASREDNSVAAAFNIKPGDEVIIEAK